MTISNSKQRFANRVADYVRYRAGHPQAVLDLLRAACSLQPDHIIADVGSGTGLLSELFLENGNCVFAVEPNDAMRQAGEEYLRAYERFTSVKGSAEATTLADASVDFVSAAQAFHWFDQDAARREFLRILRPGGWVVVLWNELQTDATSFLRDYEAFLQAFGTDYRAVTESYPRVAQMNSFFAGAHYHQHALPHHQEFDFDGLGGRVRSSSYMPSEDHPKYPAMMAELQRIFSTRNQNGRVRLEYTNHIYFGQLPAAGASPSADRRDLS